jgi:hypothetical protein
MGKTTGQRREDKNQKGLKFSTNPQKLLADALEVHPQGEEVAIAQSPGDEGIVDFQPVEGPNAEPSLPMSDRFHQSQP